MTTGERRAYLMGLNEGKRKANKRGISHFTGGLILGAMLVSLLAFTGCKKIEDLNDVNKITNQINRAGVDIEKSEVKYWLKNPQQSNANYLYRIDYNGQTVRSFDTNCLISFIGSYGTSSQAWDLNSNGIVESQDLQIILGNYGNEQLSGFNLDSLTVDQTFSSGAQCTYTGVVEALADTLSQGEIEAFLLHPYEFSVLPDLSNIPSFQVQPVIQNGATYFFIKP